MHYCCDKFCGETGNIRLKQFVTGFFITVGTSTKHVAVYHE